MKTRLLDDTWRKLLGIWTSEYQASPEPTPPPYQKRSDGWFEFKFQEGRSGEALYSNVQVPSDFLQVAYVSASSATPSWFWSIDDKLSWGTNVFVRIAG